MRAEAVNIDKEIKDRARRDIKVAVEAEQLRKEGETTRVALTSSRGMFKDRYQKTVDEIMKVSQSVNQKYASAQQQLDLLKVSMGGGVEPARLDSLGKGGARGDTEVDRGLEGECQLDHRGAQGAQLLEA